MIVRLEGARSAEPPMRPGSVGCSTFSIVCECARVASACSHKKDPGLSRLSSHPLMELRTAAAASHKTDTCCFKRVNMSCELQLNPELSARARPCGQDNAAARALPFSSHTHTLSSGV